MTMQYNVAEAKAKLSELLEKALLGEEIILAKGHKPIAKLVPLTLAKRTPGTGKGGWMAPDFDDIPEDFKEYR